jgi:hypothetical protein
MESELPWKGLPWKVLDLPRSGVAIVSCEGQVVAWVVGVNRANRSELLANANYIVASCNGSIPPAPARGQPTSVTDLVRALGEKIGVYAKAARRPA